MDFFIDLILFAVLVVGSVAFMGIIIALIGETIAGKRKNDIYDQDCSKRVGWKKIKPKAK